jgi:hypothetical protein
MNHPDPIGADTEAQAAAALETLRQHIESSSPLEVHATISNVRLPDEQAIGDLVQSAAAMDRRVSGEPVAARRRRALLSQTVIELVDEASVVADIEWSIRLSGGESAGPFVGFVPAGLTPDPDGNVTEHSLALIDTEEPTVRFDAIGTYLAAIGDPIEG